MQKVELAPHQRDAVSRLHNGSILSGGVGTGKSRVAMQYYIEKEMQRDVIVITTAKKRDSLDWESEAVLHGVGTRTSVPRAGNTPGTITVDSWNNLWKYVDVSEAFFIFDEQRLVGSGAWVKVFWKIAKKNRWILLSATPGDTWLDYIPVFVANGFYKNKTEFMREHVIFSRFSKFPKVERYIAVNRLVKHRNNLLVDMPYERHTTRHIHMVDVDHDEALYKKVVKDRWHVFENRPLRDVAEMFSVMRKAVATDSSRLDSIRGLMEQHPKVIVFYNFDYELEILRSLATSGITTKCDSLPKSLPTTGLDGTISEKTPLTKFDSSIKDKRSKDSGPTKPGSISTKSSTAMSSSSTSREISSSRSTTKSTEPSRSSSLAIGEWNGHKHEPIPKTDRWVYLVQYTAGAEGWNCIETDAVVFYSLNYSYRIFEQCMGRIDRLNTPFKDLHYYVLRSKASIDVMIWKALRVKKKFNEPRTEEALQSRNVTA